MLFRSFCEERCSSDENNIINALYYIISNYDRKLITQVKNVLLDLSTHFYDVYHYNKIPDQKSLIKYLKEYKTKYDYNYKDMDVHQKNRINVSLMYSLPPHVFSDGYLEIWKLDINPIIISLFLRTCCYNKDDSHLLSYFLSSRGCIMDFNKAEFAPYCSTFEDIKDFLIKIDHFYKETGDDNAIKEITTLFCFMNFRIIPEYLKKFNSSKSIYKCINAFSFLLKNGNYNDHILNRERYVPTSFFFDYIEKYICMSDKVNIDILQNLCKYFMDMLLLSNVCFNSDSDNFRVSFMQEIVNNLSTAFINEKRDAIRKINQESSKLNKFTHDTLYNSLLSLNNCESEEHINNVMTLLFTM